MPKINRNDRIKDFTITLDGSQVPVVDFTYEVDPIEKDAPLGDSPPASGELVYYGTYTYIPEILRDQMESGDGAEPYTLTIVSDFGGIEAQVFLRNYRRERLDEGDPHTSNARVRNSVGWFATRVKFVEPLTDEP